MFVDLNTGPAQDIVVFKNVNRTTFTLFTTGHLLEAKSNKTSFNAFNKNDLQDFSIWVLQRQGFMLYQWLLLKFLISNPLKIKTVSPKFFEITPNNFKPTDEETREYLHKPRFMWRYSITNYNTAFDLFSSNSIEKFEFVLYKKDYSGLVEFSNSRTTYISNNFKKIFKKCKAFKHHSYKTNRIFDLMTKFKFVLNEYESLEYLYSDELYLYFMDSNTSYKDFVSVLLTGQYHSTGKRQCQLRERLIVYKNVSKKFSKSDHVNGIPCFEAFKNKLTSSEKEKYEGAVTLFGVQFRSTIVDEIKELVNKKKTEVFITNPLYLNENWVHDNLISDDNNYHSWTFYEFAFKIFGWIVSVNNFTRTNSNGRIIRTAWKLPCNDKLTIYLLHLYKELFSNHYFFDNYVFRLYEVDQSANYLNDPDIISNVILLLGRLCKGQKFPNKLKAENISTDKIIDPNSAVNPFIKSDNNSVISFAAESPIFDNGSSNSPLSYTPDLNVIGNVSDNNNHNNNFDSISSVNVASGNGSDDRDLNVDTVQVYSKIGSTIVIKQPNSNSAIRQTSSNQSKGSKLIVNQNLNFNSDNKDNIGNSNDFDTANAVGDIKNFDIVDIVDSTANIDQTNSNDFLLGFTRVDESNQIFFTGYSSLYFDLNVDVLAEAENTKDSTNVKSNMGIYSPLTVYRTNNAILASSPNYIDGFNNTVTPLVRPTVAVDIKLNGITDVGDGEKYDSVVNLIRYYYSDYTETVPVISKGDDANSNVISTEQILNEFNSNDDFDAVIDIIVCYGSELLETSPNDNNVYIGFKFATEHALNKPHIDVGIPPKPNVNVLNGDDADVPLFTESNLNNSTNNDNSNIVISRFTYILELMVNCYIPENTFLSAIDYLYQTLRIKNRKQLKFGIDQINQLFPNPSELYNSAGQLMNIVFLRGCKFENGLLKSKFIKDYDGTFIIENSRPGILELYMLICKFDSECNYSIREVKANHWILIKHIGEISKEYLNAYADLRVGLGHEEIFEYDPIDYLNPNMNRKYNGFLISPKVIKPPIVCLPTELRETTTYLTKFVLKHVNLAPKAKLLQKMFDDIVNYSIDHFCFMKRLVDFFHVLEIEIFFNYICNNNTKSFTGVYTYSNSIGERMMQLFEGYKLAPSIDFADCWDDSLL